MGFEKATKEKAFLRAAIFGPSGAGKTYSSLRIATGIAKKIDGKIGVIDSERKSARKYADRFDFEVLEPDIADIDALIKGMGDAFKAGIKVLVIDSMTHAWDELKEEVQKLSKTHFGGNYWAAWSKGTPKQNKFIDTLLRFPGHVIVTMRSKTEWIEEKDTRGRSRPKRVGLSPEQGKGIEYEFDLLLELNTEHEATVIKDRTGKFQDELIDKPDEAFGEKLIEWLLDGAEPQKPAAAPPAATPPADAPPADAPPADAPDWASTGSADVKQILTRMCEIRKALTGQDITPDRLKVVLRVKARESGKEANLTYLKRMLEEGELALSENQATASDEQPLPEEPDEGETF